MGQWLFGCDLCQTCCPFEVGCDVEGEAEFSSSVGLDLSLAELLVLDEAAFRARFRTTPLWRPRRIGLLRNAVIVVANGEHVEALPAVRDLLDDPSPVLREVASWCLGRLGDRGSRVALERALACETDSLVLEMMRLDLELVVGPS
jgi:epoxyqueuosine reductase